MIELVDRCRARAPAERYPDGGALRDALEALVAAGWMEDGKGPDIIAGTSIGAINAAALASGLTVADINGAAEGGEHVGGRHRSPTTDALTLSHSTVTASALPPPVRPRVNPR